MWSGCGRGHLPVERGRCRTKLGEMEVGSMISASCFYEIAMHHVYERMQDSWTRDKNLPITSWTTNIPVDLSRARAYFRLKARKRMHLGNFLCQNNTNKL